jgi:phospholipid/cholesterol/gamma-HCH transport system substrate-binding protein
METRASYLLVGAFALLAMAGFVTAVVWMAGMNLRAELAYYDIFFEGSVTGLKPGNPVRYRGIPVGVVSDVSINPENVEQVRVMIEVPADTPVKTDTVASLEFQGLTGVAYVQLSAGTNKAAMLKAAPDQPRPVINSRPSQLQELFDYAPELAARVTAFVDRMNALLSPANRENFGETLANVRDFTNALASRGDDVGELLSNLAKTTKVLKDNSQNLAKETTEAVRELRRSAKSLQKLSGTIVTEVTGVGVETKRAFVDVQKTAVEVRRAAFYLADMLESNREPVNAFASSGLFELTQLLSEMRVLVNALARISSKIETNPGQFLFGKSQPGVEVQ